MKRFLTITILTFCAILVQAQSNSCQGLKNPINFSLYQNYSGQTGTRENGVSTYTQTFINLTSAIIPNTRLANEESSVGCSGSWPTETKQRRFLIMGSGSDPNTSGQLPNLPNSDYISSIRLGNTCYSAEAEALYYTMTVTPQNALVFIYYAIVLENALHSAAQNPEFIIRVKRQNGNAFSNISDTLFYVVQSPVSGGSLGVWTRTGNAVYKPWAKAAINLYDYLYETIRIEVLVGDCQASGHYGYCYIAGDCQPMTLSASGCSPGASNEVATITAPSGLSGYQWYRSRYGELGSNQINVASNFEPIPGTRGQDSILDVYVEDFPYDPSTGNRYQCNTFKCVLTSYLDPSKPIRSSLYVSACNQKPTVSIGTHTECDGSILVSDLSTTPTSEGPVSGDTARSRWTFLNGSGQQVGTGRGGRAMHTYPTAGNDSVTLVTVSPLDSTCYTQRTMPIHIRKSPNIGISLSRRSICANDTVTLRGTCSDPIGIIRHSWVIHDPERGDTTLRGNPVVHRFANTSTVEYTAMNADSCVSTATETVSVGYFPDLVITGDSVVCIGSSNTLHVSCDLPGCSYEWYTDTMQSTPVQRGDSYTFAPTRDGIMFAKVISPYGCSTWSLFRYRILIPEIAQSAIRVCAGEEVVITGRGADYYTWTSNPHDPSLDGQDSSSSVSVTPRTSTTYTMIGHAANGCGATPLTATVTVDQFPQFSLSYTPEYIDIFSPVLYLGDYSSNRTHTTWTFPTDGTYHTSTSREYEYNFINVTGYDSIPVKLTSTSGNGCSKDTTFYVPVDVFTSWVPTVFTPTRDVNRTFGLRNNIKASDYTMTIYNRNGLKVFETHDQNEYWDGTYKGRECPVGSYVWIISYRQFDGNDIVKHKGTVLLLK